MQFRKERPGQEQVELCETAANKMQRSARSQGDSVIDS